MNAERNLFPWQQHSAYAPRVARRAARRDDLLGALGAVPGPSGEDEAAAEELDWVTDEELNDFLEALNGRRERTSPIDAQNTYFTESLRMHARQEASLVRLAEAQHARAPLDRLAKWLVPVHVNRNHWALLVVMPARHVICVYDSLTEPLKIRTGADDRVPTGGRLATVSVAVQDHVRLLRRFLQVYGEWAKLPAFYRCPWLAVDCGFAVTQPDSSSCGLFCMAAAALQWAAAESGDDGTSADDAFDTMIWRLNVARHPKDLRSVFQYASSGGGGGRSDAEARAKALRWLYIGCGWDKVPQECTRRAMDALMRDPGAGPFTSPDDVLGASPRVRPLLNPLRLAAGAAHNFLPYLPTTSLVAWSSYNTLYAFCQRDPASPFSRHPSAQSFLCRDPLTTELGYDVSLCEVSRIRASAGETSTLHYGARSGEMRQGMADFAEKALLHLVDDEERATRHEQGLSLQVIFHGLGEGLVLEHAFLAALLRRGTARNVQVLLVDADWASDLCPLLRLTQGVLAPSVHLAWNLGEEAAAEPTDAWQAFARVAARVDSLYALSALCENYHTAVNCDVSLCSTLRQRDSSSALEGERSARLVVTRAGVAASLDQNLLLDRLCRERPERTHVCQLLHDLASQQLHARMYSRGDMAHCAVLSVCSLASSTTQRT